MMDTSAPQDDVFTINENIENFVVEAEKHFIRYDIVEFMRNFPWLKDKGTVAEADRFDPLDTINLFNQWDQIGRDKYITLKRIADTTVWVKTYLSEGSESYLDDLDWQHKYFLDCMDTTLLQSVLGELKNEFEEETHGGPLTFAVLIEKCINLSHDAIDALKADVVTFTLANIPGENVDIACRRLLYALKRLENNGALPHDAVKILFKIFKTCSVPEFLTFITHWETSLNFVPSFQQPSYKDFLTKVKEKYTNMCVQNAWTGVKAQGSVFSSKGNSNDPSNIWRNPTDLDKISSSPVRYQREIKGKMMRFCEKCFRRGTRERGRWNTTHFTDEHGQNKDNQNKDNQTNGVNIASGLGEPSANVATPPSETGRNRLLINQLIAEIAKAKIE